MCDAVIERVPTPTRASHISSGAPSTQADADVLQDKVRLEQELETDRKFFADPPDDFVRCPTCNVVYAVHMSRPSSPADPQAAILALPASYSRELPHAANLSIDEAARHMHRSRFRCGQCGTDFCRCGASPYHWGWSCDGWQKKQHLDDRAHPEGTCRWCSQRSLEGPLSGCCGCDEGNDLKRFPPSLSCAERERRACGKKHRECGHWCGGVRGEEKCLPCLNTECRNKRLTSNGLPLCSLGNTPNGNCSESKLPDGNDWCPICWTEPLNVAPAIQLACGHVLHHHCAEAFVKKGQTSGRRLTFKNIRCPLCQAVLQHPSLNALLGPQFSMYLKVRRKALQRWVVESRVPALRPEDPLDEDRIASLAMTKMAFFDCSQCHEPYYGGEVECGGPQLEEEQDEDLDEDVQMALAMELVCRGCASKGQLQCPEHGTDFLGWKCRYCCDREAHYFCFGTTHFCHSCHDIWQTGVEQRRKLQVGKPCLGKDKCIFGGRHPIGARNGRGEYALGCTICAQDTECGILVNRERRAARRRMLASRCSLM